MNQHNLDLIFSIILLGSGLLSAYIFINGGYEPYTQSAFLNLCVIVGTVLAIALGAVGFVVSIYSLNDEKEREKKV